MADIKVLPNVPGEWSDTILAELEAWVAAARERGVELQSCALVTVERGGEVEAVRMTGPNRYALIGAMRWAEHRMVEDE